MKRILITGATSGLGLALAEHAANEGYSVIACGRNQDALDSLNKKTNISTLQFDLTDAEKTQQALSGVNCDIAVLNAGTCEYVDALNLDTEMFRRVFDINFFGVVNALQALLPNLTRGSKVVLVDSMARLLPFTQSQAYGASKAALYYACKSFEVDLHKQGIDFQSVSPGFVKTPLTDKNTFAMPMAISAQQAAEKMLKGILTNRSSIYFPTRFGLIMRFLNLLPQTLQTALCKKMSGETLSSKNMRDDKQKGTL